jgi:hypothetical protein
MMRYKTSIYKYYRSKKLTDRYGLKQTILKNTIIVEIELIFDFALMLNNRIFAENTLLLE